MTKTIEAEIDALRRMRVPELVARYEELHGRQPRVKHKSWLWRRCAWRLQEQRYGGLPGVAKRRLDELIGELDVPELTGGGVARGPVRRRDASKTGTTLVREYRGREVRATAVEGGWECDGVVYRSLSAIVKAVTGSHASGPAWFGVARKGAKP